MKKVTGVIIFFLVLMVIGGGTAAVGDIKNKQENIRVYPLLYEKENEVVKIKVEIPVIKGIDDKLAQEQFNREIRDNILNFTEKVKTEAEKSKRELSSQDRPFYKYQAFVDLKIKNEEKILSLIFNYYQYTGGAHGITTVKSFNIDSQSGENLTFEEILEKSGLNQAQIQNEIITQIEQNPKKYFSDAKNYVKQRKTFDYYLEAEHLVIFFQHYSIAPYAAGISEFKIKLPSDF